MALLKELVATTDAFSMLVELPNIFATNGVVIVESSGSTGTPKRIELSSDALLASARASLQRLGGPGQWLLALPSNYVAGVQVLVRSLVAETQPVIMNTAMKFTAEAFVRSTSMLQHERKYVSLVPTQLKVLFDAVAEDGVLTALKEFDAVLVGGQAPNPHVISELRQRGVNLVITYGMTETAGGCVYDGVALDGVKVRLSDDGEILVAGTTLANNVGEEFATADVGMFDEYGRLIVTGRRDRVINSGGIKLSLDAVEQWARSQPGVKDAVAAALQHPHFGQSFICWIVVNEPESFELDSDASVRDLGVAASTAIWANLDELPLLANGKPDIRTLELSFVEYQRQLRSQN